MHISTSTSLHRMRLLTSILTRHPQQRRHLHRLLLRQASQNQHTHHHHQPPGLLLQQQQQQEHLSRGLSTTSTAPTPPTAAAAAGAPEPPKASPGIISRNIGKIVLSILTGLIAYLYRSSENKKRSKALKVYLEDRRAIEPWEIDEFRVANDLNWDRPRFQEVAAAVHAAFPSGQASYRELIQVVAKVLGPERRLQLAHYLDRVVLSTQPEGTGIDTLTFLCALSLSLNVDITERIYCLYDALVAIEGKTDKDALQKLLAGLVATAQLPAEVLVKPDKAREYPFQGYQVATIEEITERAILELKEEREKDKGASGVPPPSATSVLVGAGGLDSTLSMVELTQLLCCKSICAWGECYQGRG